MKQLRHLAYKKPTFFRAFTTSSSNEDLSFKIPTFNAPHEDQQPVHAHQPQQQQHHPRVERMRERQQPNKSVYTPRQQYPPTTQEDNSPSLSEAFDRKITEKFGPQALLKINQASNKQFNRSSGSHLSVSDKPLSMTMQNYNSFDAPENTYEVKKVVNQVNELKRVGYQKHKYSSFDNASQDPHSATQQTQPSNFYLNRDRISVPLATHQNEIVAIENDWQDTSIIPTLQNGLDVILKNPGIFPVESINQYQRGKLNQFFTRLPQYSQINESCISPYYPPGQDQNLMRIAQDQQCRYVMSTSTISSVLSHIYYCLSNFKSPHFNNLSEAYDREPLKFMISQRKPNTVFLTKIDKNKRIYSVDGDSGFIEPSNVVLLKMGKYMEKMLTTPSTFFEDHYVLDPRTNQPRKQLQAVPNARGNAKGQQVGYEEDYFRYMKSGNLLLRSQIDCQGVDSEGRNVIFELKTRATSVLRYEIFNYIDYLDYEIVKYKGKHSSYEREFYDLIRGGFLKYIMQCKIGRMQGALIAYHNTQKVFGFEYIKLEDMEKRVFGCTEFSDVVFKSALTMTEKIFDYILQDQDMLPVSSPVMDSQGKYAQAATSSSGGGNKIFKIGFYANEYERFLNILVEVFDDDMFYQERFKNVLPEYMRDPIDYYVSHKIQPQVYKYVLGVYPVLNGQFVDHSPILFEPGDNLEVKHTIQRYGRIEFNEYMKFLHEAYKCDSINLDNEYAGTWSFVV